MAERLTIEQARERAAGVLAGAIACAPMHELEDAAWPEALPPVLVTAEAPMREAVALYGAVKRQRGRSGLSPLIVTRDGYERLRVREWLAQGRLAAEELAATLAAYDELTDDTFFAQRWEEGGVDPAALIEAALDNLARMTGGDPMSILHRIRLDDLEAIESGEGEIDPDDLLPDDVASAHARMLVEREALLEVSRRASGRMLVQMPTLRCFDEETLLAEITGGPARLLLTPASPATALLHLGFGGFNDCPPPHAQARAWQHWAVAFGAEPVLLDAARLQAFIARPVATRGALVRFAANAALYDRELLTNGPLALAGRLYRNAGVDFWWD